MTRWGFSARTKFKRQYGRLDPTVRNAVDISVENLLGSDNPTLLGRYKQGMGVFAYDLGRKYRIIYRVNWNRGEIEFLRVCDHKSVYGKD